MWSRCGKLLPYFKSIESSSRSAWISQSRYLSDIPQKKTKLAPLQERRMIDRFSLLAKGGDGGNGCESSRKSRHERRGKPDGGNGGRGGDVILESSPTLWDFSSLQHHVNAKKGGHGGSKSMIGSRGSDKVVLVPVGTVIHLVEGEIPSEVEKSPSKELDPWDIPGSLSSDSHEPSLKSSTEKPIKKHPLKRHKYKLSNRKPSQVLEESSDNENWEEFESDDNSLDSLSEEELDAKEEIQYNIAELTEPGQRIIIAQGGEGGLGNISLSGISSLNEDENTVDRTGLPGSEVLLILELKSIADVGLVGMPNAGKSTLLGAMSRAKPRIGHYAFTTLRPNLGNVNYDDFSVTVADIPGLIKGAHEDRGLGHAFLRHIERTKVLAYVLDLGATLDGRKGISPWMQLHDLIMELEFYSEGLSDRPCLVVANKIDEAGAIEVYEELKRRVCDVPIFPVCAVLGEGVTELKDALKMLVNEEESYRINLDNIKLD